MKKISLCMIVKNEEKNLDKCLTSIKDAVDEIIIVDTGSTDKTKEVASNYTDKIYDFEWCNDFSKARNYSFDKASCPYIMWMDADDVASKETVKEIKKWKKSEEGCDTLMCSYATSFDENHKPIFEYYRERIMKNIPVLRWKDPVHEVIIPWGKVVYNNKIVIYHDKKPKPYTTRNLDIYKKMLNDKVDFSPRQQFYYARELYFNNLYDEAIHEFSKFLSSRKGWNENNIEACLNLSKCYQYKKEYENALTALFGSFMYGVPKGEILFEIGNVFETIKDYPKAIYWYKQALASSPNLESGAFVNLNCYQLLPAIQLCVCYYQIGDLIQSRHYHEVAKSFNPNDENVLYNEKFFNNLDKKDKNK